MYERFTDRARKVMLFANQEAQRFNHEYIGTEHVLLGLLKEGHGVGAHVLKNLDIDTQKVTTEIEKIVQHGPDSDMVVMGRLPHTPRTKQIIEWSIEEARNLGNNYVGTEHILLGILRVEEGVAAQVLMNLGLKIEDARTEVLSLIDNAQVARWAAQRPALSPRDTDGTVRTILTRERITKLLIDAGRAINANNGRYPLIEETLCTVTGLCCTLLADIDGRADMLAVCEAAPVPRVGEPDAEFHTRYSQWRVTVMDAVRKAKGGDRDAPAQAG